MKTLLVVLTTCLAGAVQAQMPMVPQTTNAPRTYFDAFANTADALLIKGMTTVGTLNNQINFPVEIRVERMTNLRTTNTIYAVALRTTVERQVQVDYIDYDELDTLIRSVPMISQANTSLTPMENFEAIFHTRSGLTIAKIVKLGKTYISMTSGDTNGARNQMAPFVLDDFGRIFIVLPFPFGHCVRSDATG
jgi:hypothetical protein